MRLPGKLVTAVLMAAMIGGCGTSVTRDSNSSPHPKAATHPKDASPKDPGPKGSGSFRVGTVALQLAEPSTAAAPTAQTSAGQPIRSLPTVIRYPAAGSPNGHENPGATPDLAQGPFPLVVFSQGYDVSADAYAALLDAWASAGYVVAAPTYPDTDPAAPGGPNEVDLVNHPADLRFVLASLLGQASPPLGGLIDRTEVAVVGQSDGGDVSLAVADNNCCTDRAVKAAVILSGAELASFGGTYYRSSTVPLLVVQGSNDTINPPGCSAQLYDQSPSPKYFVNLLGAEHLPPYLDAGTDQSIVERTTIDFLNAYLKHGSGSLSKLSSDASVTGSSTITSSPTLAVAPTYCPGAP